MAHASKERKTSIPFSDFAIFSNEQFYLTILRTVIISIPINSMVIFLCVVGFWDLRLREIDLNVEEKNSKAFMCKLLNRYQFEKEAWSETKKFKWCFNKLHWRNRNNNNTNNNDTSHFKDWCVCVCVCARVCIQFTENGLQSNDYDHSKMNEENREN